MTPGSAGGELGNHRALRWGEIIPVLIDLTSLPSLPVPQPPLLSQPNNGRIFDELWLSSVYHSSAQLPFPSYCHRGVGAQWGRCSPGAVIEEATFCLDRGGLADKWATALQCHTKRELRRCCPSELRASWEEDTLLYALCKYPFECSRVIQVKCKLQTVVNNCDITCTPDRPFLFATSLFYLLWYLLQRLAG